MRKLRVQGNLKKVIIDLTLALFYQILVAGSDRISRRLWLSIMAGRTRRVFATA